MKKIKKKKEEIKKKNIDQSLFIFKKKLRDNKKNKSVKPSVNRKQFIFNIYKSMEIQKIQKEMNKRNMEEVELALEKFELQNEKIKKNIQNSKQKKLKNLNEILKK